MGFMRAINRPSGIPYNAGDKFGDDIERGLTGAVGGASSLWKHVVSEKRKEKGIKAYADERERAARVAEEDEKNERKAELMDKLTR